MTAEAIVTDRHLREVAVPSGSPAAVPERARAHARARARVATTLRDGKAVKVWRVVRADLAGSWLLHNQPPSLAQMWQARRPAAEAIPAQHKGLYLVEAVWRTGAALLLWPVFAYLWLLHRALTGIPTVVVTAVLAAMWLS